MSNRLEKFIQDNRDAFDKETPRQQIWRDLQAKVSEDRKDQRIFHLGFLRWTSAAAVVILLVGMFYYLLKPSGTTAIAKRDSPTIVTPDQVVNELNPTYAQEVYHFTQLIELKQLAMNTVELANLYRQAGDNRSAQGALELAMGLGQRYSSPSPGEAEVSQLVGMAIERKALGAMDPTAAFGNEGGTVQDRIQQIQQQEIELKEMNQRLELIFQRMSEHDWVSYRDRWLMFGEENAARWVINKYGEP
jgi:hypothetical protein